MPIKQNCSEVLTVQSLLVRRATVAVLAGGLSLGLAGCADSTSNEGNALNTCKLGWEAPTARTTDPSSASTSMQTAIALLIDKIDKSGARENKDGYRIETIPHGLVGAATGVLEHSYGEAYVKRSSILQEYSNEICVGKYDGSTYLTPAYLSAVGSLAAADIKVDINVSRGVVTPTSVK